MGENIPTTFAAMTPAWLTETLRGSGMIGADATIATASHETVGTGEGFIGEIGRFALTYASGDGPASVVAKIPTTIKENQSTGQLLGVYEREIMAYSELLPALDVPIPTTAAALIDPDYDGLPQFERALKGERLPVWLLRWILKRELKAAEAPACVLVMEDLSSCELGDQVAGCDLDRAAKVVQTLARFHGSGWGPRCPEPRHWLARSDVVPKAFQASHLNGAKNFRELAGPLLSDRSMQLFDQVSSKRGMAKRRTMHEQAPTCVNHGDFRLDNLFFSDDGSVKAVFDWQIPYLGPAVLDLCYFLCGSLDREVDAGEVDDLLAVYHETLVEAGVTDYPLARLIADYEDALLVLLHRFPLLDTMEFGEERGVELIEVWLRRFDRRLQRLG